MLLDDIVNTAFANSDVVFCEQTDLGTIAKKIQSTIALNIPADSDETDISHMFITEMSKHLESEAGHDDLSTLNDYSLKLCDVFNTSFTTLKTRVKDDVASLSDEIYKMAETLTTSAIAFYEVDGVITPNIPEFYITSFELDGNVVDAAVELKTKYNVSGDKVTPQTLNYLITNIKAVQRDPVSPETIDKLATELFDKRISSTETTYTAQEKATVFKQIRDLVASVCDANAFDALKRELFSNNITDGYIGADDVSASRAFMDILPYFSELTNTKVELSKGTAETINANLLNVIDLKKCAMLVLALAEQKYEGMLVINDTLLNKNEFVKFEKLGGSLQDIANYIRLNYNHNQNDILYSQVAHAKIPVNGIPTTEVYNAMDQINHKLAEYLAAAKTQLNQIKHVNTNRAFSKVLTAYIIKAVAENPELIPEKCNKDEFLCDAKHRIAALSDYITRASVSNIEDAVYSFYLKTWYKNSLVSTIFYRLGIEAIEALDSTSKDSGLTGVDVQQLTVSVMIDILTAYISSVFIVPAS